MERAGAPPGSARRAFRRRREALSVAAGEPPPTGGRRTASNFVVRRTRSTRRARAPVPSPGFADVVGEACGVAAAGGGRGICMKARKTAGWTRAEAVGGEPRSGAPDRAHA